MAALEYFLWLCLNFTCSTLYELGPLIWTAEGWNQDLVESPRCEWWQDTLPHPTAQSERWEHFHVTEQQLHFIVIHITWSCQPRHPKVLSPPSRKIERSDRCWDWSRDSTRAVVRARKTFHHIFRNNIFIILIHKIMNGGELLTGSSMGGRTGFVKTTPGVH